MRAVVSTASLLFAATLYFSILSMVESRAAWLCTPCMTYGDCDAEPVEYCMWGETRNACNRRVCAKGPGERCGGHRDILGKCGTGMWCAAEEDTNAHTCHGCYGDSLDCHSTRY